MTKLGNIIIIISVITFAIKNGAADLNIFSMLNPVIIAQTFKQFPTGVCTHQPLTRLLKLLQIVLEKFQCLQYLAEKLA